MRMSIKLTLSKKQSQTRTPAIPLVSKPTNIFGDDEDSDSGMVGRKENAEESSRRAVNRELEATQQRAERAVKKAEEAYFGDPDLYDYDSFFDKKEQQREQSTVAKREKVKDAKYMTSMLQSSIDRKIENDVWRAAQMRKEAEQIRQDLDGNVPEEKFVTKAWKDRLEEIWQHKQRQAQQDAEDEKAGQKRTNFGKSLINFRERIIALSDKEQEEVKLEKEQMQEDHYTALNLGIKKSLKKDHHEEVRVEQELRRQEEGIAKQLLQAAESTIPTSTTKTQTDGSKPEGQTTMDDLVKKFGPSKALLRWQQRKQEPPEARLERKRKRWASAMTADDIAAARERFLERMAAHTPPGRPL